MKLAEILANNYQYLYHGTNIWSLASIVDMGEIHMGMSEPKASDGVRCSRSYSVALLFAVKDPVHMGQDAGGVIVLDQQQIRTRYKIEPFQGYGYRRAMDNTEAEEIIVTRKLPLKPYTIAIVCEEKDIKMFAAKDYYEYAQQSAAAYWGVTYEQYLNMLQKLVEYPGRRETWNMNLG